MTTAHLDLVRSNNRLSRELQAMREQLEKLEQHDGGDGSAEDIDAQVKLIEEIHAKQKELGAVRSALYPK